MKLSVYCIPVLSLGDHFSENLEMLWNLTVVWVKSGSCQEKTCEETLSVAHLGNRLCSISR